MNEADKKFSAGVSVEQNLSAGNSLNKERPFLAKIVHPLIQARQWVYDSITLLMLG